MKYAENEINTLRGAMKERLSEKRYNHTLGVEKMAMLIGKKCLPSMVDKLRVAALLHDISKEYSEAEHLFLINKYSVPVGKEDLREPALWHSFTAAAAVRESFPQFADEDVLSAVFNHTVGSPDMTVFDEIILLSDYIEEGRTYENCVNLRREFLEELSTAKSEEECVLALHRAVAKSLDNNINEFISRGKNFHVRTKLTRDAVYNLLGRKSNGKN